MIKYVIFDMDGVIYDTEILFVKSFVECIGPKFGLPITHENMKPYLGLNDYDSIQLFKDMFGRDDYPDANRISTQWMDDYVKTNGLTIKPGVIEVLTWLKEHKIPIALASGSSRHLVERNLTMTDMWKYFDVVLAGERVLNGKPNPEIFNVAANDLGCTDKSECLILEDSINGVRAANNGGFPVFVIPDLLDPTELPDITYNAKLSTLFEAIPLLEKMI